LATYTYFAYSAAVAGLQLLHGLLSLSLSLSLSESGHEDMDPILYFVLEEVQRASKLMCPCALFGTESTIDRVTANNSPVEIRTEQIPLVLLHLISWSEYNLRTKSEKFCWMISK